MLGVWTWDEERHRDFDGIWLVGLEAETDAEIEAEALADGLGEAEGDREAEVVAASAAGGGTRVGWQQ